MWTIPPSGWNPCWNPWPAVREKAVVGIALLTVAGDGGTARVGIPEVVMGVDLRPHATYQKNPCESRVVLGGARAVCTWVGGAGGILRCAAGGRWLLPSCGRARRRGRLGQGAPHTGARVPPCERRGPGGSSGAVVGGTWWAVATATALCRDPTTLARSAARASAEPEPPRLRCLESRCWRQWRITGPTHL